MLLETALLFEVLLLGIASGLAAGLILRAQVPVGWLMCAGMVGVALEPALHTDLGPHLFNHSLLASIAVAALVIIVGRAANAILQTWQYQFRRS
jgi:uncharacterized membrane protein YeaQ/YmgE (transglycosylase-associated protein family)